LYTSDGGITFGVYKTFENDPVQVVSSNSLTSFVISTSKNEVFSDSSLYKQIWYGDLGASDLVPMEHAKTSDNFHIYPFFDTENIYHQLEITRDPATNKISVVRTEANLAYQLKSYAVQNGVFCLFR
jgi:hypothetical protein